MTTATHLAAVDLDRYPIHDLDGPSGQMLIARCREELASDGACDLPGFLRPEAVAAVLAETDPLRGDTFRTETTHNIEFSGREAELADDDPLKLQVRSAKHLLAYDQVPQDSPLRAVYESDELTRFVGAALQAEPIHRSDDELGALNVMYYETGDELGWHFDNADFAVTLMLQAPDGGGAFEYVPSLRTPGDANPEGVRALLQGTRDDVRALNAEPGTLALFRGHLSPHRVTPVTGATPRVNAVLCYAATPDAKLTESARRIFFGR